MYWIFFKASLCIICPKVDLEIFVLYCDNGTCRMDYCTYCSLYFFFWPGFHFFCVDQSDRMFKTMTLGITVVQIPSIWVVFNRNNFIAASMAPFFRRPNLWCRDKKNGSILIRIFCVGFLNIWMIHFNCLEI